MCKSQSAPSLPPDSIILVSQCFPGHSKRPSGHSAPSIYSALSWLLASPWPIGALPCVRSPLGPTTISRLLGVLRTQRFPPRCLTTSLPVYALLPVRHSGCSGLSRPLCGPLAVRHSLDAGRHFTSLRMFGALFAITHLPSHTTHFLQKS